MAWNDVTNDVIPRPFSYDAHFRTNILVFSLVHILSVLNDSLLAECLSGLSFRKTMVEKPNYTISVFT